MTSQRLENLQLWADSDDRRARHTLFPSQISYKACAYYLVFRVLILILRAILKVNQVILSFQLTLPTDRMEMG